MAVTTLAICADTLSSFNRANQKNSSDVFIPKRGEKDFEPLATTTPSSSSTHQTLSDFQANTLINSRNALFSAISSGSRHHGSKAYNSFTWRPAVDGGRATADGPAFGVHFMNLGVHSAERKRLELLPEEALYMVERGAIELWKEEEVGGGEEGGERGEVVRVPMTVQQAWAELIGRDELTIDRFGVSLSFTRKSRWSQVLGTLHVPRTSGTDLAATPPAPAATHLGHQADGPILPPTSQVYAYLKRLGYVVVRARAPPPAPARPAQPAPRSTLDLLRAPLLAARAWLLRVLASIRQFRFGALNRSLTLAVTRTLQAHEGTFASLLAGRRWATYGTSFGRWLGVTARTGGGAGCGSPCSHTC